jgi:peptidoglycan/LPS O-acetylase OafA/YrhL
MYTWFVNRQNEKFKFIQLWRALAVLAVISYHYAPETVTRGYLGVDLFFVISGYVITKSFNNYDKQKYSSYLSFFSARVNRLIPTILVVFSTFSLFTIFLASPINSQVETFSSIIANFFGISNIYFYRKPSGYFDTPLEFSTFLHTWSLSLEWQFYIFLIFSYFLFYKGFKKYKFSSKLNYFLLLSGLFSLIFAVFQFMTNFAIPGLSNPVREQLFFLPPQRLYQFMAGVILANFLNERRRIAMLDPIRIRYFQLTIFISFILFIFTDSNSKSFDLIGGLFIVLLVSLSIFIGEFIVPNPIKFMVPIGNASYSLYLWHWPVLIFFKLYIDNSRVGLVGSLISTSALSILTYKFIELNNVFFANNTNKLMVSLRILLGYVAIILLIVVLIVVAKNFYWNHHQSSLAYSQEARSQFGKKCWTYPNYEYQKFTDCRFNVPKQEGWVLLVGDSHAYVLSDGLLEKYRSENLGLISYPLCDVSDVSEICKKYLSAALEIAASEDVKLIVFTGRVSRQLKLYDAERFLAGRAKWIRQLNAMDKQWLYIQDVPNVGADPCGGYEWWDSQHICKQKIELMNLNEKQARLIEKQFAQSIAPTNRFDPWLVFCDSEYCRASLNSKKLYLDDNHLNFHGSIYLSNFLE